MSQPLRGNTCLHVREGWQGFVYVAFVIDTFANKIVGTVGCSYDNGLAETMIVWTFSSLNRVL